MVNRNNHQQQSKINQIYPRNTIFIFSDPESQILEIGESFSKFYGQGNIIGSQQNQQYTRSQTIKSEYIQQKIAKNPIIIYQQMNCLGEKNVKQPQNRFLVNPSLEKHFFSPQILNQKLENSFNEGAFKSNEQFLKQKQNYQDLSMQICLIQKNPQFKPLIYQNSSQFPNSSGKNYFEVNNQNQKQLLIDNSVCSLIDKQTKLSPQMFSKAFWQRNCINKNIFSSLIETQLKHDDSFNVKEQSHFGWSYVTSPQQEVVSTRCDPIKKDQLAQINQLNSLLKINKSKSSFSRQQPFNYLNSVISNTVASLEETPRRYLKENARRVIIPANDTSQLSGGKRGSFCNDNRNFQLEKLKSLCDIENIVDRVSFSSGNQMPGGLIQRKRTLSTSEKFLFSNVPSSSRNKIDSSQTNADKFDGVLQKYREIVKDARDNELETIHQNVRKRESYLNNLKRHLNNSVEFMKEQSKKSNQQKIGSCILRMRKKTNVDTSLKQHQKSEQNSMIVAKTDRKCGNRGLSVNYDTERSIRYLIDQDPQFAQKQKHNLFEQRNMIESDLDKPSSQSNSTNDNSNPGQSEFEESEPQNFAISNILMEKNENWSSKFLQIKKRFGQISQINHNNEANTDNFQQNNDQNNVQQSYLISDKENVSQSQLQRKSVQHQSQSKKIIETCIINDQDLMVNFKQNLVQQMIEEHNQNIGNNDNEESQSSIAESIIEESQQRSEINEEIQSNLEVSQFFTDSQLQNFKQIEIIENNDFKNDKNIYKYSLEQLDVRKFLFGKKKVHPKEEREEEMHLISSIPQN